MEETGDPGENIKKLLATFCHSQDSNPGSGERQLAFGGNNLDHTASGQAHERVYSFSFLSSIIPECNFEGSSDINPYAARG